MAVVPKQQKGKGYDPSQDLTADQIHRFGKAANTAMARRKRLEQDTSVFGAARRAAFKPVVTPKKDKPNTTRYAIWLIVVMAVSLWAMYMSR